MRRRGPRPIWMFVLGIIMALILLNRLSVQNLKSADDLSIKERQRLAQRLDLLEARVRYLERAR